MRRLGASPDNRGIRFAQESESVKSSGTEPIDENSILRDLPNSDYLNRLRGPSSGIKGFSRRALAGSVHETRTGCDQQGTSEGG
jgi:hypothetical protein